MNSDLLETAWDPNLLAAAEAAYCAGDQNMFWEYHNVIYENKSYGNTGGYSEKNLIQFAKKLEMDINVFETCLTSNKYEEKALNDLTVGRELGVSGTPSILVNGEVVFPGNVPFDEMQAQLNQMLSR